MISMIFRFLKLFHKAEQKENYTLSKTLFMRLEELNIHGYMFNNTFQVELSLKMFIIKNRTVKKKSNSLLSCW